MVAAADLALRLTSLAQSRITVNPARIDGGGPNNVVPDRAVLRVNIRVATSQHQIQVEERLESAIRDVSLKHGVEVHCHGGFGRPPKAFDAATKRLFDLVKACGARLGQNIEWMPSGGVCDGNNIAACGVPVVDTMGVCGGAIHSSDEFMIPESLAERARLSALVLLQLSEQGRL